MRELYDILTASTRPSDRVMAWKRGELSSFRERAAQKTVLLDMLIIIAVFVGALAFLIS